MDRSVMESTISRLLEFSQRCTNDPCLQGDLIQLAQELLERLEGGLGRHEPDRAWPIVDDQLRII
jgi:hypothetical protein